MIKRNIKNDFIFKKCDFKESYRYFLKDNIFLAAGPCALESEEQILKTIKFLISNNIEFIRVFPYKVRTSPYEFDGLKDEGIEIIKKIKDRYKNIRIISEIFSENQFEKLNSYVDIFQIGTRFMYHRDLLRLLGKHNKPIILKRGFSSTIYEWLLSAEFYLKENGKLIILCERGIRTFENSVRNSFDITSIISIREFSKIPVIIDPSHILGKRNGIEKLILASYYAGFNGAIIEVHPNPNKALSDKYQQLNFNNFSNILNILKNHKILKNNY
jgi:3-deoxy-7-phosphoheptulonate synthase